MAQPILIYIAIQFFVRLLKTHNIWSVWYFVKKNVCVCVREISDNIANSTLYGCARAHTYVYFMCSI
jgi:hypothetical protein